MEAISHLSRVNMVMGQVDVPAKCWGPLNPYPVEVWVTTSYKPETCGHLFCSNPSNSGKINSDGWDMASCNLKLALSYVVQYIC